MKVNHKTFSGGFRFKTFEGSPSEKLLHFEANLKVVQVKNFCILKLFQKTQMQMLI